MASERGHDLAAGCGHARTGRDDRLADDPGAGVSDARERREAVYGAFPGAGPASGRGLTGHRMPFRGSFRPWGSPNSPGSTSVPRHRRPGPAASTPTSARKRTLPPWRAPTLPWPGCGRQNRAMAARRHRVACVLSDGMSSIGVAIANDVFGAPWEATLGIPWY